MTYLEKHVRSNFDKDISDCTKQELYKVLLDIIKEKTQSLPKNHDKKKKLYYFSAEFLIGKLLSNNLLNLGIYDEINNELIANGINLMDIEEVEPEPSLGNGGLGRLAACFLDSITTLGINGDGIGLNYHFGLFKQVFTHNEQRQLPDPWITQNSWLTKNQKSYQVPYRDFTLTSTLYEIDVVGYNKDKRNRLRLFDLDTINSKIIENGTIHFDKTNVTENLTLFLYPDDSDHEGRLLRLFQQYFMVSNGAQLIIDEAMERGSNLYNLPDYVVIQINDTHPALVIPEMIRLLVAKDIPFEEAVKITQSMTAFTNHTILAEALEKWPLQDIERISPAIVDIIQELDKMKKIEFNNNPLVQIIDEHNIVHMASLAIHFGFSINGVAKLHTEILKNSELSAFYDIYPNKFINVTNGITFRRWIMDANKELADYIDDLIGEDWRTSAYLEPLAQFKDNTKVTTKLRAIKFKNKVRLKKHLHSTQGIILNEHSIIDVHIKRIHEYKRQQMLLLYIIHKYFAIKNGHIPNKPITIIFGGKAAAAYTIARDIIHAILTVAELISNDPKVSPYLQVIMVENYNVTHAQYLIPATDISEQISLASKEASGTGNMKFMLNGALTICTLDGANVEISNLVGEDNIYIFGKRSDEIVSLYANNSYDVQEYYHRPAIKPLVDFLLSPGMLYLGNQERLSRLHQDISQKDYFMALIDLEEFIQIKEQVYRDYEDQDTWASKTLINISKAGFFSSDRTINDYNRDIWHLEQEVRNVHSQS